MSEKLEDLWAEIRKGTPGNHIVSELVETIDGIGKVFGFDYRNKLIEAGFPSGCKGQKWKTKMYTVEQVVRNISREFYEEPTKP